MSIAKAKNRLNKIIITVIAVLIICLTNAFPFFSSASSTIRSNIVAETIVTYLMGPVYGIILLLIENFIKVKLGLFDTFLNYTLILKLINILILSTLILIGRKIKDSSIKDFLTIFFAALIETFFGKYIASRVNSIFVVDSYVNSFSYYMNSSIIISTFKVYFLSAVIAFLIVFIDKKILTKNKGEKHES